MLICKTCGGAQDYFVPHYCVPKLQERIVELEKTIKTLSEKLAAASEVIARNAEKKRKQK